MSFQPVKVFWTILWDMYFSFLLNKVFVAGASKPKAIRNKSGFILYASNSPQLNSRAKKKQKKYFFSTLGLIASIKNITQSIQKKYCTMLVLRNQHKILQLISKAPPSLLLICRQNSNVDYLKLKLKYTISDSLKKVYKFTVHILLKLTCKRFLIPEHRFYHQYVHQNNCLMKFNHLMNHNKLQI